jgi:hypothetical protein
VPLALTNHSDLAARFERFTDRSSTRMRPRRPKSHPARKHRFSDSSKTWLPHLSPTKPSSRPWTGHRTQARDRRRRLGHQRAPGAVPRSARAA